MARMRRVENFHDANNFYSKRSLSQQAFLKIGLRRALGDKDCISEYLRNVEENDMQSLRSMYLQESEEFFSPFRLYSADKVVSKLLEVGQAIGLDNLRFSSVNEEQEKELSHEVEQEIQVERPREVSPTKHRLQKVVRSFVRNGNISDLGDTNAFIPAFQALQGSSTGCRISDSLFHTGLFVTRDFATTVELKSTDKTDDYLRPVNFILSLKETISDALVIISPWEANELMDDIHDSTFVSLHLYAPKIAHSNIFLDDLKLYTVCGRNRDSLRIHRVPRELNIFSGQLYLKDSKEYEWLLSFLTVGNGSIDPEVADTSGSRRELLKAIVTIRRKGQDFSRTHVGRILDGERLNPGAFEL
jgi:hypothetical protein